MTTVRQERFGVAQRVRQYLRIAREFARIGVIRKSQFRVEFLIQVAMDTCFYASHILVFEVLFAHTHEIAGWSLADVRILLGFLFVSDAFMMVWLGQAWHFGRELKDGKLDPVRVRPAAPAFLYFFQRFSLEGSINMLMAAGYLAWGIAQLGVPITLGLVGLVVWATSISWWVRTSLTVLFASLEFRLLNSDVAHFCQEFTLPAAERPLDIFAVRVKWFLLFLIPVGGMSYLPASMVLGRTGPLEALGHTVWLALLGIGALRLFHRGFRRYESALS